MPLLPRFAWPSAALVLGLCLVATPFAASAARAEELQLARLDPGSLSGLTGVPAPAPLPASAARITETTRADAWIVSMHEARARRERAERWAVPLMFGLATVAGLGAAAFAKSTPAQLTFAGSALLAGAELGLSFAMEPAQRGPFFVLGGSLFAATFSAGAITDAYQHDSCQPHCIDKRAFGWLGGALAAEALTFIPMAFVDRGPTRADLAAYGRLPIDERPHAARMLLGRIDRAERKALTIALSMQLAVLGVLATGAAVVRDDPHRAALFAVSGVSFAITSATTFGGLLKKTRLERFIEGERPDSVERVFW